MIVIVDYKMGNLGSILNALKKVGVQSVISSDISDIQKADKLILPGVGAFDNGMKNIKELGLIPVLNQKVLEQKTPILGICLGMQLFTKESEEGCLKGLGWIDARTKKFKFDQPLEYLKIPHMGWNTVRIKKDSYTFRNMYEEPRFYFVHSYHVVCKNEADILTTTQYGFEFISSFHKDNIVGMQFHPEKSHKFGLKILKDFAEAF